MLTTERRTFTIDELRVETHDDGSRTLHGHAAVFGSLSLPIGGMFRERIESGAFARAIEEGQDVRALFNHDTNIVLGRTKSGTLKISEDAAGLSIECRLPATQLIRDMVVAPIERGDVDQMSFGFRVRQGGERFDLGAGPDGADVRVLTDLDLFDVGPNTFGAYPDTDVAVRSYRDARRASDPDAVEERGLGVGMLLCISEQGAAELSSREPGDVEVRADVDQDGALAVVRIIGPTSKYGSAFWGEPSTKDLVQVMDDLRADDAVHGVLLSIDSPGGQASGNDELAQAISRLDKAKPVHVYADDTMASAAVWYGSQARHITMNRMGEVGSIGTYAAVMDMSEMAKKSGVKVHVVSSGGNKGAHVPGAKVSKGYLAKLQARVNSLTDAFVGAVAQGRGLDPKAVAKLATGDMFGSEAALSHGLVDAVGTFDTALFGLSEVAAGRGSDDKTPRLNMARRHQMLAESEISD